MLSAARLLAPKVIKELTQTTNKANDFFRNLIDNKKFQEILGNLSVGEVKAWEALDNFPTKQLKVGILDEVAHFTTKGIDISKLMDNGFGKILKKY